MKARTLKNGPVVGLLLSLLVASPVVALAQEAPGAAPASGRAQSKTEGRVGVDESTPLSLSLSDAVAMALTRNQSIEVERINSQEADLRVKGAQGAYDPTVRSSLYYQSTTTPYTALTDGIADGKITTRSAAGEVAVTQTLPTAVSALERVVGTTLTANAISVDAVRGSAKAD